MNLSRTLALAWAVTVFCLKAAAAEPVIVTVAKADDKHVRNSEGTAVGLKDGRLLLAWIEFTKGEGDSDFFPARIVAKTSKEGGKTWDGYRVLAKPESGEISVFSPNLLRLKDGRLLFVYMRYLNFAKAQNKYPPATTVAMISGDEGKTFSRLATVLEEQPITVCSHSLKQLASGRIVLPLNRNLSRPGIPGGAAFQSFRWRTGCVSRQVTPHPAAYAAGSPLVTHLLACAMNQRPWSFLKYRRRASSFRRTVTRSLSSCHSPSLRKRCKSLTVSGWRQARLSSTCSSKRPP